MIKENFDTLPTEDKSVKIKITLLLAGTLFDDDKTDDELTEIVEKKRLEIRSSSSQTEEMHSWYLSRGFKTYMNRGDLIISLELNKEC
jgi:hypothetical protein